MVETHCYIVGDPVTKQGVIIDPSAEASRILETVEARGWHIGEIWLTHAHFDHVLALGEVKTATGATIKMHKADVSLLEHLPEQLRQFDLPAVPPPPAPDVLIDAGDVLQIGDVPIEIRFTPGHTRGHLSFVAHADRIVFSGDCLFAGSIGRTDTPGGDHAQLIESIRTQLLALPDDYRVAAGHMDETTIGKERATNPFLID